MAVAPVPGDEVVLGAAVNTLQSGIAFADGKVSGESLYKTGYTEFSADPAEQSGNYLAVKATAKAGATITAELVGGESGPVTLDESGIHVFRITSNSQSLQFVATLGEDSVTFNYSLEDLVLDEEGGGGGLTPFAVGDAIVSGSSKLKVDKTQNVDAILAALPYSDGVCSLLDIGDTQSALSAINFSTLYLLSVADGSSTGKIIYANEDNSEMGITAGWQNLDANDETTFGASGTIASINGDGWNGVLVGKAN